MRCGSLWTTWMWIYGVIIIFIVGYWMFGPGNGVPVKSDWNTVAQMIEQGDVEKIQVVNRDLAEIYLKKDAADRYRKDAADPRFRNMPETGAQLTFNIGSVDTFRQDLDKVTAESGNKVEDQQDLPQHIQHIVKVYQRY